MDDMHHLSSDSRILDLSKKNLDNHDLIWLAKELQKCSLIECVNLSDNKFSLQDLEFLISTLNNCHCLREFDFSNNWAMDKSMCIALSFSCLHDLTTLRLCNSQIDESRVEQLYSLKFSHIEHLYLDDNSIGDAGVMSLLTMLNQNSYLTSLSLMNTDISDSGIQCLCSFLQTNETIQSVDIRHNRYHNESTHHQLESIHSPIQIQFDSYSDLIPSSNNLLHSKVIKDFCIVLQLLAIQMEDLSPVIIPKELVFNSSFENHRIIVSKLLNQPSLLANRIECIVDRFEEECNEEEKLLLMQLIEQNFSLLMRYITSSVTSHLHVSSTHLFSPVSSANSSPSLVPCSSPFQSSVEFDVVIGKDICTTAGMVKRSGIVKLQLLNLFDYLLDAQSLLFFSIIISHQFNHCLLGMYEMYPWNSAIHHCITSILIKELSLRCSTLSYDCIVNHGLVEFLAKQLMNKERTGYRGFLQCICKVIEERRLSLGCPFLCLYQSEESNLSIISSPDKWIEFYHLYS